MQTWGDYEVANRKLTVANLQVRALGGSVAGRLDLDFNGLAFRTQTQTRGISLAQVFSALENKDFPVPTLHWDGAIGDGFGEHLECELQAFPNRRQHAMVAARDSCARHDSRPART